MALKMIGFFILLSSYTFTSIIACSCIEGISPWEAFSKADQVFIGIAVNATESADQMVRKIVFYVEENFKGILPSNRLVSIYTHTQEAACGLQVQQRERWQIWAYRSYEPPNQLETSWCSKSTKKVLENIDFLRQQDSSASQQKQSFSMLTLALVSMAFIIFFKTTL